MINIPTHVKKSFSEEGFTIISQDAIANPSETLTGSQAAALDRISLDSITGNRHIRTHLAEKVPDKQVAGVMKSVAAEYDIPTIVEYLNWHMNRISENVINRSEIIHQAMFAILTGEHMLLLSRTGMAKSYLTNYIFNTFEGARVFSQQASKDQTPDNYFGPYNIDEFKKGRIRHNIKGSIIEANLVFLDEFFDASDVVLRALLSILNERKFINGSEQIDVAVHTAIATANYMRMNEVTEAVLDRFTYKSIIPEDTNVYSQLLIDHTYAFSGGKPVEPEKKLYFNQILFLNEIIKGENREKKIVVPDFIYFMKNVIVNKYMSDMRKSDYNFFVSPRKIAKLSDFLRASALLHNRFEVNEEDLKDMYIALCTLNSYVSVKAKDKSERDVYLDAYQQTMVHFNASGAIPQIEFLLNVRKVLQEIREDPDKRESILSKKTILDTFLGILKKLFPTKRKDDDKLTIESLKSNVLEMNPAVEEVNELKNGILRDYKDLH